MSSRVSPIIRPDGRLAIVPQRVESEESASVATTNENQGYVARSRSPSPSSKAGEQRKSQDSETNQQLINRMAKTRFIGPVTIDIDAINRLKVYDFEAFLGPMTRSRGVGYECTGGQPSMFLAKSPAAHSINNYHTERTSSVLEKLKLLNSDVEKRSMILKDKIHSLMKSKPKSELSDKLTSLARSLKASSSNPSRPVLKIPVNFFLPQKEPQSKAPFFHISTSKSSLEASDKRLASKTKKIDANRKFIDFLSISKIVKNHAGEDWIENRGGRKEERTRSKQLNRETSERAVRKQKGASKSLKLSAAVNRSKCVKAVIPTSTRKTVSRDASTSGNRQQSRKSTAEQSSQRESVLRRRVADLRKAHLRLKSALCEEIDSDFQYDHPSR